MTMNYTKPDYQTQLCTASGPVAAGELVTLHESGRVMTSSTLSGISSENNTTIGLADAVLASSDTGANNYSSNGTQKLAFLSNGNIVYAYTGDGTTATTAVNFKIKIPSGGTLLTVNNIDASTSINAVLLISLPLSGRFAMIWSTAGTLKLAVYANNGSVVAAPATVSTGVTSGIGNYDIAALASGEFIVFYISAAVNFKRYTAAGVLQGAETLIETATAGALALLPCANGDFVTFYFRSAATATYKFARWSSIGALVVALTSMVTTASALDTTENGAHTSVAELTNGNTVFVATSSLADASASPCLYVYSAAGALVKYIGPATSYVISGQITPVVATTDGFAVASNSSNTLYLRTFDNNGQALISPVALVTPNGMDSTVHQVAIFNRSNILTFMFKGYGATSGLHYFRLLSTDMKGILRGSVLIPDADSANDTRLTGAAMSQNNVLAYIVKVGLQTNFRTYRVARCSVLGVAINTAVDGGAVTVTTKGNYTLPATQNFNNGGIFDQRTAVVPGTRGMVTGRSVMLFGQF